MITCVPLSAKMSARSCAKRHQKAHKPSSILRGTACFRCEEGARNAAAEGIKVRSGVSRIVQRLPGHRARMECGGCGVLFERYDDTGEAMKVAARIPCPACAQRYKP